MQLAHTMLRVRDLEASLDFYTDFLNLREVRRKVLGDEATLVFLTDASGRYHLELTHNHDGRDYELGNQFGHIGRFDRFAALVSPIEHRAAEQVAKLAFKHRLTLAGLDEIAFEHQKRVAVDLDFQPFAEIAGIIVCHGKSILLYVSKG